MRTLFVTVFFYEHGNGEVPLPRHVTFYRKIAGKRPTPGEVLEMENRAHVEADHVKEHSIVRDSVRIEWKRLSKDYK